MQQPPHKHTYQTLQPRTSTGVSIYGQL